ncbi:MAG TPA: SPOR domain-containing protein [Steroidobacteraceae bacterium]|jgi:cell division protein FtsN
MNKALLGICLAVVVGLAGCSRQQSDWEKTRAANTTDSYEQFLKKYPNGEFAAQAHARAKELYEERDWQKARDTDTQDAYQAFLKQYPEGKWTEEARIRVENFNLAQAPSNATPAADSANNAASPAAGSAGSAATAQPPAPAPALTAKPAAAAQLYGIQLGAFKSGADAANRRWAHLNTAYPTLLAGLSPIVTPKKGASGTLYRLQATGLTDQHARAICRSLKAHSQPCVVIHPAHA